MSQTETEQLAGIVLGAALSRALDCVAELGIADLIEAGRPQPVSHLASASKTNEGVLYRVLRYLAGHGIFQETEDRRFDHTRLSAALRTDAPGSFRAGARLFHHLFAGWDGLYDSLLTGEPGCNKIFGMPVFEWVAKNPHMGPIFDAGMTSLNFYETASMLEHYDFSGIQVLADIGGGNGSLMAAILGKYPQMKGIVFDLDHVAGRAREALAAAGLGERCRVMVGNFFESVPSGADAYLFRHIIHDWTDAQCTQILGHCRKVIPPNGKLLVADLIVPRGNTPSYAKGLDITMMTFPGGRERTEAEFRSLFEAAGFAVTSVTDPHGVISVVEGRPV